MTTLNASKEQIVNAFNGDEYEAGVIIAMAETFNTAKSWEGRKETPYWNLGDIAAAALTKLQLQS